MHLINTTWLCTLLVSSPPQSVKDLDDVVQSAAIVFSSPSTDVNVEKHFHNLQSKLLQIGHLTDETVQDDIMDEDLKVYTLCLFMYLLKMNYKDKIK